MKLIFYDFEVFKKDWLVVLIEEDDEGRNQKIIVNSEKDLRNYYALNKNNIWIGYNSRHYDVFILQALLSGLNPKDINDKIIKNGESGYNLIPYDDQRKFPLINYDVMNSVTGSLKLQEGYLGDSIEESSVSFDIDRKLTEEELKEVIQYCIHDVKETIRVFELKKSDFEAHCQLIEMYHLPRQSLNKTKVQLSAQILEAQKRPHSDDDFDIIIPSNLILKKYANVKDWFLQKSNQKANAKFEFQIRDISVLVAWGGIHGALKKYHDTGYFLNVDVASLYPSIDILYSEPCFTRAVDSEGLETYKEIKAKRLELKNQGKKKEQAPYKIVLNGTYGAMKDKYNKLYDPRGANNTCVYGQLFMLDLIEKIEEIPDISIVQVNTDGILMKITDENSLDIMKSKTSEWEQRTGLNLDFDYYKNGEIYQKDVNNYVLINRDNNTYKSKGAYVKSLNELDYDMPIVNKALIEYMVNKKPIENTINSCNELKEFQIIRRNTNKYDLIITDVFKNTSSVINQKTGNETKSEYLNFGNAKELNLKTVRIFASKNKKHGGIYKRHATTKKYTKMTGTPNHVFLENSDINEKSVDEYPLDKNWYIDEAKKRLRAFVSKKSKKIIKSNTTTIECSTENINSFFEGYFETNDKKEPCVDNWKDPKYHVTLAEAKKFRSYAGVLREDFIVVDVDEYSIAEILLNIVKTKNIQTTVFKTTRGMHFYFIKPKDSTYKNWTEYYNLLGIKFDYRVKGGYIVLKHKGEERNIIYDNGIGIMPYYLNRLDKNPRFLLPIKDDKGKDSYQRLGENSGRNDLFYNYIIDLTKAGLNKDQCREVINIINTHVLAAPLSQKEIDTICRDESFDNIEVTQKTKIHEIVGEYLINERNACRLETADGALYVYDDTKYVSQKNYINKIIRQNAPGVTDAKIREIRSYLRDMSPIIHSTKENTRYILFKNGIYHIDNKELMDFTPNIFIQNQIPWDYNSQAESDLIDQAMNDFTSSDQELIDILYEVSGYCLYRAIDIPILVILYGPSGTGKSTFLELLQVALGRENVSNISLESLGNRFTTSSLLNKMANIGDDISDDKFIQDTTKSIIKQVTAGNTISAEFKGQDVFSFKPYAKNIFATNALPKFQSTALGAITDRILLIPFEHRIRNTNEQDTLYIDKLTKKENIEYFLYKSVQGLDRLLSNQKISSAKKIKSTTKEFEILNDSILQWVDEDEVNIDAFLEQRTSTTEIYQLYKQYCVSIDVTSKKHNTFIKDFCDLFGLKKKNTTISVGGGKRKSLVYFVRK